MARVQSVAWVGWFRVCGHWPVSCLSGQGLVSGSGCMAKVQWVVRVCGQGLVSQLLGWFRLYGQGLGGSGCVAGLGWFRLCQGQGLVSCLDGSGCVASELLGWFRLCGRGLVSCLDGSGCVARVQSVASSQLLGVHSSCAVQNGNEIDTANLLTNHYY